MESKWLIISLLLFVYSCGNNNQDNQHKQLYNRTMQNVGTIPVMPQTNQRTETDIMQLHDTLKQYVSDACRADTKKILESINTLFTNGKYDVVPENEESLEKVIHENGKTIYRFNFQNQVKMLLIKEEGATTSVSTTIEDFDAFIMMGLAIMEMSRDSVQIAFNNNDVYTGYLYKNIVAVPCVTNDFHQVLYFEQE